MQTRLEIQELLEKYLADGMSATELTQWKSLLRVGDNERVLTDIIENVLLQNRYAETSGLNLNREDIFRKVMQEAIAREAAKPVHRVHFLKTAWFRYAAAIVIVASLGVYFWLARTGFPLRGDDKKRVEITATTRASNSNKAILTLASGKKIELDDQDQGKLVQPDGVEITTPRGAQYQVILPDGTKVWLNAASGIKFPSAFAGKERRVETTGEIYFEVSVNKMAPFVVSSRGVEVQVLGTSFNINAYEDEEAVKTTLVDGSVRISSFRRALSEARGTEKSSDTGVLLKPGQAYVNGKVIDVDINQVVAWKNGVFNFEGQNLPTVLRQLARWYDVDIVYENGIPDIVFVGEMQRNLSLSQALKVLSKMEVHFRLEGRKLIIMP